MKNKSGFFLLTLALVTLAATQGGEFWEKKDYHEWSEKECRKLLEESPWAQSYTLSQTFIEPTERSGLNRTQPNPSSPDVRIPDIRESDGGGRAREPRPQIKYQVQFRSALPIRQALVRLEQIRVKYDQMQPQKKQVADQRVKGFLAVSFPDTVVLHISYESNVQVDDREMARHWQNQTTETLKNFVFLIGSEGEKAPLSGYVVSEGSGREFQFIFPRQHKGRPLAGPQDKTLQLEFIHPKIRGQAETRVLISFKVEKMMIDEATVY